MKPAGFGYVRPRSLDEALAVLDQTDGAQPLAGGQSLIPLLSNRQARPSTLVDINRIEGLDTIVVADNVVRIGSMARHRALEDDAAASSAPMLSEAAAFIGYHAIRNRGTIGGSLANADPRGELPAVLVALGGSVTAASASGERDIAATDLFVDQFVTSLDGRELITHVNVPVQHAEQGSSFIEFNRLGGGFAIVGIAVIVRRENGVCSSIRGAGAGLGRTPIDLTPALQTLVGDDLDDSATVNSAIVGIDSIIDPPHDIHGSTLYRRELAQLITAQAVATAWRRAAHSI